MALTNDNPSAKKILCDNCDGEDAAQSRCNECGIFLCQYCTESHKRYRSTKHHKLFSMEELKSNSGPQTIAEKIRCQKHKEEVIKLFCKTCQTTICRDCTIVDHRQHDYGFVEEVASREKKHLQSNLNEVKLRKVRVWQGILNLKKFNEGLEDKKNSTISAIIRHFDELIKAAELRKREMIQKATSLTNAKQKQIRGQLEVLEVALATCKSSIEFTELAFKNGNDVQILSMEKNILQSLQQLKAVKDQTKPSVTEDMMFVIPSSVQKTKNNLLNKYDVNVSIACPEKCHSYFNEVVTIGKQEPLGVAKFLKQDDNKKAEEFLQAGKQYSLTLICNDKNNQRLRYGGQDIKPSFTGVEVSNVAVNDKKDGSYAISFCPRQDGMLKFKVSINGIPARKCSLTKQVKWVIGDVHGKGVVTNGGQTMHGEGHRGEYCCRVGGCYFESGVHAWIVQVNESRGYSENAEIGIIDYDEISADVAKSKKKWVFQVRPQRGYNCHICLTLNMEKQSLNVTVNSSYCGSSQEQNYQFKARRVSPFFACSSPNVSISLVQ